ncbi:MAG: hypothetical protein LBT19_02155 [Candidatus Nomurabacteria bacterium]|jgi:uncharacterized membrane protein|nr:hypothetical protein [Candidatus Nomurabacteria bacterium]
MATVEKIEKKVNKLEGLVLANRFGAKTIWSGFMTTIISSLIFIVVFIPVMCWAGNFAEQRADGAVVLASGGGAAVIVLIAVFVAYYVALMVGVIRMLMGFYRMAHPEKCIEKAKESL